MSSTPLGLAKVSSRAERGSVDTWPRPDNLYDSAVIAPKAASRATPGGARPTLAGEMANVLFRTVRTNIVQSIRAFRVPELAAAATELGHHFLYANCAAAQTRPEVLDAIASSFLMPKPCGKNYEALKTALTATIADAGEQFGFVIVLEGLPNVQKFDAEARETLLDVFRDAADYWAERRIPFRVFFSFA